MKRGTLMMGASTLTAALALALLSGPVLAQALPNVPRNKTLVVMHDNEAPVYRNVGMANPYSINNQDYRGSIINMFEPLFYYNSNKDQLIPWLAIGFKYSPDFKTVTLNLRKGVTWSDGQPFTADDVVFTYQMLIDNGNGAKDMLHASDIVGAVKSVEKTGPLSVKFTLTEPDPRFAFKYMINYFDIGLQIIPKHIWENVKDKASFNNFDLAKGWPVTTGPWKLTRFTDTQVFMDRRADYWGSKTGFTTLPTMERIITVPGANRDRMAQAIDANQVDMTGDLQVESVIKQVVAKNPKVTTFTGKNKPYGDKDWWPTSLYFNHLNSKWSDVRVRQAIDYYINRKQIIDVVYNGASEPKFSPWPGFGSLEPYIQAVKPLAEKYGVGVYDVAKGDALMKEAGYAKNANGIWAKDGKPLVATVETISVLNAVAPVVAQQLKQAGIDATFRSTPESRGIMRDGKFDLALFGHRGSISDPYATMETYTCKEALPVGQPTLFLDRWCNKDYDKIVDQIATMEPSDPKIKGLVVKAMDIWMKDAVEAPIMEWYHRIPMNQTYWTNWPSEQNPYMQTASFYTSGAFGYVLHQLKPAGK